MRVLVIEDEKTQAQTLRQCLHHEGFAVEVCDDSLEAESLAASTRFDLLLISLLLPDDGGFELLRGLRRQGVTVPILALIGAGNVAERVRCLDLGADGYLTRPIHLAELVAHARALVRRKRQVAEATIRVADLEIDLGSRAVTRAGMPIRLTRREYGLLEFLAINRGKVCSRSFIWEHLYEGRDEVTSNVVDVFIRFLRGKIDRGFDKPLIQTRWGQGYMLRDETPVAQI